MYINVHSMISRIDEIFRDKPAQKEVAKLLLKMGISVKGRDLYLGNLKIPYKSVADALGIDRRVVIHTINEILKDDILRFFYQNLLPAGPFLRDVARDMGYTCLTIVPHRDQPGILAAITSIIAKYNVNIVQVIAEDPELYPTQKVYIVVEGELPGEAISEIMKLEFIKSLQIQ